MFPAQWHRELNWPGNLVKKFRHCCQIKILNKDFTEMLQCSSEKKVEFLLVGGYALAAHGFPRATKAIDFWVAARPENSSRFFESWSFWRANVRGFGPNRSFKIASVDVVPQAPRGLRK